MAVLAKWLCDRDGTMFDNKKDAEAYDKMLELGEQFCALVEKHIPGVDAVKAEEFGILLAKNKEIIIDACKGKPELLEDIGSEDREDNVTPLVAEA